MVVYQGKKFKEYLEKRGIKAVDAAKTLGVSRQNVYQYFKSKSLIPETVNSFIDKFKIDIEEMFPSGKEDIKAKTKLTNTNQDLNMETRLIIRRYEQLLTQAENRVKELEQHIEEITKVKGKPCAL